MVALKFSMSTALADRTLQAKRAERLDVHASKNINTLTKGT
jgi:hypothetical protein